MSGRKWDDNELQALLNGIGAYGIKWLQKRTKSPNSEKHRSVHAIYAKARRQWGKGGLTRGALTLHEFSRNTNYGRSQLLRARDALRQKWKRLGPGGDHIITEEQAEEVITWLQHDYWDKDKHLYCCLGCQTEKSPPHGLGLCSRCYFGYRRMCIRLELPTGPDAQAKLLKRIGSEILEGDKSSAYGKFLEEIATQLGRGRALTEGQLEWLHLMQ